MTNNSHPPILTTGLQAHIAKAIGDAGGWIGFDRFMALALYTPGLGYYANDSRKFGLMPTGVTTVGGAGGSDFVTAPELSPRFGQALARQLAQALQATGTSEIWEFGAGSGALALQLLEALGPLVARYTIVDVSGSLVQRQRERLAAHGGKVHWVSELPAQMRGVVVGNEVLDAMPVKLLSRLENIWHERGVVVHQERFTWADQRTELRPPLEVAGIHDYLTEIHPQAEGFVRTLADRLEAGAVFMLDYGFPEHEYYHPQRSMGTVMCHRGHLSDADALVDVGSKDITAHVNFTGIALAGQDAGLQVLGYTGQGRFLLNCGLLDGLENAGLAERAMVQKLITEHEMGELFKVIGFATNSPVQPYGGWQAMGFAQGDRTHTL
ncbi:class I SAM-dependent methyltransferase [Polaromonas sp.]|uniref:class I SAM-dependent methyltransferase n=1 Tax=Polaromonas sp. TaxID=1869339 RepID=UPI003525179E